MYAAEHYTDGYWSEGISGEGELHLVLDKEEKEYLLLAKECVDFAMSEDVNPSKERMNLVDWFNKLELFLKENWGY